VVGEEVVNEAVLAADFQDLRNLLEPDHVVEGTKARKQLSVEGQGNSRSSIYISSISKTLMSKVLIEHIFSCSV
jgi:hypothetical protein